MISGEFISLISNVQWSIGLLCHSGFPAHQNVVVSKQNIPHSVQSFIFSKTENPDANVMKRSKKKNSQLLIQVNQIHRFIFIMIYDKQSVYCSIKYTISVSNMTK